MEAYDYSPAVRELLATPSTVAQTIDVFGGITDPLGKSYILPWEEVEDFTVINQSIKVANTVCLLHFSPHSKFVNDDLALHGGTFIATAVLPVFRTFILQWNLNKVKIHDLSYNDYKGYVLLAPLITQLSFPTKLVVKADFQDKDTNIVTLLPSTVYPRLELDLNIREDVIFPIFPVVGYYTKITDKYSPPAVEFKIKTNNRRALAQFYFVHDIPFPEPFLAKHLVYLKLVFYANAFTGYSPSKENYYGPYQWVIRSLSTWRGEASKIGFAESSWGKLNYQALLGNKLIIQSGETEIIPIRNFVPPNNYGNLVIAEDTELILYPGFDDYLEDYLIKLHPFEYTNKFLQLEKTFHILRKIISGNGKLKVRLSSFDEEWDIYRIAIYMPKMPQTLAEQQDERIVSMLPPTSRTVLAINPPEIPTTENVLISAFDKPKILKLQGNEGKVTIYIAPTDKEKYTLLVPEDNNITLNVLGSWEIRTGRFRLKKDNWFSFTPPDPDIVKRAALYDIKPYDDTFISLQPDGDLQYVDLFFYPDGTIKVTGPGDRGVLKIHHYLRLPLKGYKYPRIIVEGNFKVEYSFYNRGYLYDRWEADDVYKEPVGFGVLTVPLRKSVFEEMFPIRVYTPKVTFTGAYPISKEGYDYAEEYNFYGDNKKNRAKELLFEKYIGYSSYDYLPYHFLFDRGILRYIAPIARELEWKKGGGE